jgi:hypothetical protein
VEDRRNRTFWNARFTVNAFFRMNEKNRFTFIEAFHWTYNNAVCVFAVEARLSNDMSHGTPFHARSSGDPFIEIELIKDTYGNRNLHEDKAVAICLFRANSSIKYETYTANREWWNL